MERAVIHLNVADFAVAVERTIDPGLCGRPVIIAPAGAARAAVYDMSQEAYLAGVRKRMALSTALRRCRGARVLSPRPERYAQAMSALLLQARPFSPFIEPGEDDGHLFMDITGTRRLLGTPIDVAWRLYRRVKAELGFSPIWSVAPNKLIAKVATRLVKPTGEYIVAEGEEAAFLAPLPLYLLPGLEPPELTQLQALNLTCSGQVAALTTEQLSVPFGNRAGFIHDTVHGIDLSPVRPMGEAPPRVVHAHTFDTDTNDTEMLLGALYVLTEKAGRALRDRRLAARRVGVFLDYADGVQRVRSAAVRPASANDITLFASARAAFDIARHRRVRIRRLQLACDRLTFPPAQLSLFAEDRDTRQKRTALVAALDTVRNRFGTAAIRFAR